MNITLKNKIFTTCFWDPEKKEEYEITVSLFDCLKNDVKTIRIHEIGEELINQIRIQLGKEPIGIVKTRKKNE